MRVDRAHTPAESLFTLALVLAYPSLLHLPLYRVQANRRHLPWIAEVSLASFCCSLMLLVAQHVPILLHFLFHFLLKKVQCSHEVGCGNTSIFRAETYLCKQKLHHPEATMHEVHITVSCRSLTHFRVYPPGQGPSRALNLPSRDGSKP